MCCLSMEKYKSLSDGRVCALCLRLFLHFLRIQTNARTITVCQLARSRLENAILHSKFIPSIYTCSANLLFKVRMCFK